MTGEEWWENKIKEKRENSAEIDKLKIIIIIIIKIDELDVKCKKMCQYSTSMGPFYNINILK